MPFDPGDDDLLSVSQPSAAVTFRVSPRDRRVFRTVSWHGGSRTSSVRLLRGAPRGDPESTFDWCWLRQDAAPATPNPLPPLRVADLFAGCGQMSVGAREAARAVGRGMELALAYDFDADATRVCARTFPGCGAVTGHIEDRLDGELGGKMTSRERELIRGLGRIDLLVGGPPCQGHSDLNNHTRRNDARNGLALRMARFAELVRPPYIVLENVRGVVHDRKRVLQSVDAALQRLGYRTARALVHAEDHGVPQRRHRMVMVATTEHEDAGALLALRKQRERRPFWWACADLDGIEPDRAHDQAPIASKVNQRRMDYLLDNDEYNLPNSRRPRCHRGGDHTYHSVYGRLWWDKPVQTITTGFRCMGQGRFVHPHHARTITPHEAARLQFIPDFVDFDGILPTSVARMIGNAVPPKLIYEIVLRILTLRNDPLPCS